MSWRVFGPGDVRWVVDSPALRCKCGAMLVDVELDGETIGQACAECDSLELKPELVTRQIYRRKGAAA